MTIETEKAIRNAFLSFEELMKYKFNKDEIRLLVKLTEHMVRVTEKLKLKSDEIENN